MNHSLNDEDFDITFSTLEKYIDKIFQFKRIVSKHENPNRIIQKYQNKLNYDWVQQLDLEGQLDPPKMKKKKLA